MMKAILVASALASMSANAQGHYADVNGIRMYYESHGSGQPLVLIHGGGSTIESTWGTTLPMFAKKHRVIAVELQAHGRTSDRNAPESFEQDADDVAELLRQLGVAKADVVGFSNGGSTALQIALRHPDRVSHIVPVSGIYSREGMQRGFWAMMEKATFASMPQSLKDAFLKVTPDQAKLVGMFNRDRMRMLTFKGWKASTIKRIAAPALVIVGDRDVVRVEHAVDMSHVLPNARLAVLPGAHGEFMGEASFKGKASQVPELFVAIIEEFLATPAP